MRITDRLMRMAVPDRALHGLRSERRRPLSLADVDRIMRLYYVPALRQALQEHL